MTCHEWVTVIDNLLNQFAVLIPILLAGFIIKIIRKFFFN